MACEQGSMPMVQYLVSKDPAICRITLVDFRGKTPLHLAAGKNHVHIVEFLLENVSAFVSYFHQRKTSDLGSTDVNDSLNVVRGLC